MTDQERARLLGGARESPACEGERRAPGADPRSSRRTWPEDLADLGLGLPAQLRDPANSPVGAGFVLNAEIAPDGLLVEGIRDRAV